MTITLRGRTFRVIRTDDGEALVIVQVSTRMWRVATGQDSLRVLAGLQVAPLRIAA